MSGRMFSLDRRLSGWGPESDVSFTGKFLEPSGDISAPLWTELLSLLQTWTNVFKHKRGRPRLQCRCCPTQTVSAPTLQGRKKQVRALTEKQVASVWTVKHQVLMKPYGASQGTVQSTVNELNQD